MALIVTGTIVTFDPDKEVVDDGAVYIGDDGLIDIVQARTAPPPPGYESAHRVRAGGYVFPGLIDLHNHLAYNTVPLWRAPKEEPYGTRYQWPRAATYGREISDPATAYGEVAAAAALRYAEVKAVIGGVTAIQGSPPLTRAFPGWMLRNIEKEQFEKDDGGPRVRDPFRQAVIPLDDKGLAKKAKDLAAGKAFAYHLAEGVDPGLRKEFKQLDAAGCIHEGLIGIHSTALGAAEWKAWGKIGGAVVWSPFSNLWLYGGTTDVLAAAKAGLRVCLGNDWAPSATRNLLGELKIAELWNQAELGGALSARDLCEMVTANPGDTLARTWKRPVGRLVPGALGDLCVVRGPRGDPYGALVNAREVHIRLVVIGGRPAYGLPSLVGYAGAPDAERISIGRLRRAVVMRLPDELRPDDPTLAADADLSWADGLAQLAVVQADPATALRDARARRPRGAPEPLRFIPDMPGPDGEDARRLDDDELDSLVMPPLDPLGHDTAFFDRLDADAPAHARLVVELRRWFS